MPKTSVLDSTLMFAQKFTFENLIPTFSCAVQSCMTFYGGCVSHSSCYLKTTFHGSTFAALWVSKASNLNNFLAVNSRSIFAAFIDFSSLIPMTSIVTGYLSWVSRRLNQGTLKMWEQFRIDQPLTQHTTHEGQRLLIKC